MEIIFHCSGCGKKVDLDNAGGYRNYCDKCVSVMPPIPNNAKGCTLSGKYPNFKWVKY